MPGHKCETCELTFNNFQEKLKHFTENHKNRYIKYCSRCQEAIYFLPQFTKHKKHNRFLETNPLYCSRSLVSGKILDQICPFCRQIFFYKQELEKHLKSFCRCKVYLTGGLGNFLKVSFLLTNCIKISLLIFIYVISNFPFYKRSTYYNTKKNNRLLSVRIYNISTGTFNRDYWRFLIFRECYL